MTMNSRISQQFAKQQKARVAYLTAGDGGMQQTLAAAFALLAGGVNILEIGIPFSDPIADGPIIQAASQRSIAAGTTLKDVLHLVKAIRQQSLVPIVLFSYLNPILAASSFDFFSQAKAAGVDGLLLVDCPLEESQRIRESCESVGIDLIYVITPSTPPARIKKICQYAKGFLYYACRSGTTGIKNELPEDFSEKIKIIQAMTTLPIVVGFGISKQTMVEKVLQTADGVVVGSLFVKALAEGLPVADLSKLARTIYGGVV